MGLLSRTGSWLRGRLGWRYDTMFGTAHVYDTRWHATDLRVLDLGGVHQSATFLDDRWCYPPFPYLNLYDCLYQAGRPLNNICMLGGGAYAYPKHVIAHHPQTRIDVVEIDPAITAIARRHFFLDRLEEQYRLEATGRLGLICADAVAYLRRTAETGGRYDAVLNDCFAGPEAEASLATAEAASLLHRCLLPQGIYATNIISSLEGDDAETLWGLAQTLSACFAHVCVRPSNGQDAAETANMLLIATDERVDIPHTVALVDAL